MYGFGNSKEKWNLGTYNIFYAYNNDFKMGVSYVDDEVILSEYADKFVAKIAATDSSRVGSGLRMVMSQIANPAFIWDVVHYESGDGINNPKELTELEQENALNIENVFCNSDFFYVVMNKKPTMSYLCIRIKGA